MIYVCWLILFVLQPGDCMSHGSSLSCFEAAPSPSDLSKQLIPLGKYKKHSMMYMMFVLHNSSDSYNKQSCCTWLNKRGRHSGLCTAGAYLCRSNNRKWSCQKWTGHVWYMKQMFYHADTCSSHNPNSDQCHLRQTCADCLRGDSSDSCIWCETLNQCMSKVTYHVTLPYQQCVQQLERGTGTCSGEIHATLH